MRLFRLVIKDKHGKVKVIERLLSQEHYEKLERSLKIKDVNGYELLRIDAV